MGGREVKLYYYAMKESKWGGGGSFQNNSQKEVERNQRPK